jgi:hypothetical protein
MDRVGLTRRGFLVAAALGAKNASSGDNGRPSVTDRRATDGDERFEPK